MSQLAGSQSGYAPVPQHDTSDVPGPQYPLTGEGMEKGEPDGCSRECAGISEILCTWMNLLLVFVPLGIYSHFYHWSAAARFTCNFVAIVPLAAILGGSTEALAAHTGQMIGGLLNATFGNAVEMIVTVNAIKAGLVNVVQGSLLGSILSNMLHGNAFEGFLEVTLHQLELQDALLQHTRGSWSLACPSLRLGWWRKRAGSAPRGPLQT